MRRKHKHPLCEYCKEYHDTRLVCPEMTHLFRYKSDPKFLIKTTADLLYEETTFKKPQKRIPDLKLKIDPKECEYYIEISNGKYTAYIKNKPNYEFKALRYGEPWRDLCGDNLIFSLMYNLIEANEKIGKLEKELLKDEWEREDF